jgi:hypothetical protein
MFSAERQVSCKRPPPLTPSVRAHKVWLSFPLSIASNRRAAFFSPIRVVAKSSLFEVHARERTCYMKRSALWLGVLLLLSGTPVRAQHASPNIYPTPSPEPEWVVDGAMHPLLVGTASLTADAAPNSEIALSLSAQQERSLLQYPALGVGIGALAGFAYGIYIMASTQDYLGPPAYMLTVPVGAAAGAVVGLLAHVIIP